MAVINFADGDLEQKDKRSSGYWGLVGWAILILACIAVALIYK